MNLLHKTNRSDVVMKPQTREKMVRIFKGRLTGDKLLAQRLVNNLSAVDACTSLQVCCCLHSLQRPPHWRQAAGSRSAVSVLKLLALVCKFAAVCTHM